MNRWQGEERLQLEVEALREHHPSMDLERMGHRYSCEQIRRSCISVTNPAGERLVVTLGDDGLHQCDDKRASHPYVAGLIEEAAIGLGMQP